MSARATVAETRAQLTSASRSLRENYEREDVDDLGEAVLMLAVADWLDAQVEFGNLLYSLPGIRATRVARLINGGAS